MVTQGVLPYQLEEETGKTCLTGLAGLPVYLDLAQIAGLRGSISEHVQARHGSQGWTDAQMVTSLILLNLAGGDSVEDLAKIEQDQGFATILHRVEHVGLKARKRRQIERRWRKSTERTVPSATAARSYLGTFHDAEQETRREPGQAFIPTRGPGLKGLSKVNAGLLAFLQSRAPQAEATLDMDATLIETHKKEALFCYKGFRAYQPLNVWWAEQQMVVHSEFRDGNVPAGFEQLRILKESLEQLPEGVKKVSMRSDSAGYQWDLLRYCAEGENERFGPIDFAVSAPVNEAFRAAVADVSDEDWQPLRRRVGKKLIDTDQEWAEVCFVPNESVRKTSEATYRFLAIREPLRQLEIEGTESDAEDLQWLAMPEDGEGPARRYKLFGLVTNLEIAGDEVIRWSRERCGKSEEVHAVMKDDLAGGRLPSGLFGANAAWWSIMILALNLNMVMKRLVLGAEWVPKRMKAIRYWFINLPGRIVHHARRLTLRLSAGHESTESLVKARRRIASLASLPSG